jgi:glycine/D-amino acid oxidase-like deaminating enzyme
MEYNISNTTNQSPLTTPEYIIVGQGICGTFLSYYLLKAEKKILVYDEAKPFTSSKVASGIINPVTGRRIVKTWMIDDIMPFAVNMYQQLEKELSISIIQQTNILDFHPTPQMQMAFDERLPQETQYLKKVEQPEQWQQYFNYPFGIGETNPCWLVDVQNLMNAWRTYLLKNNLLIESQFNSNEQTRNQQRETNNEKQIIIFCDGVDGFNNPFFKNLPYSRMKGEALIVSIPNLPRKNIYKHGLNIVPWKEDLWWVGSSYEWQFENIEPTEVFRKKMEMQLNNFLKLPYTVIDHIAAERPANMERRPFVGLHPIHQNIGILNGMGTKGCSLAPYFAHELTEHLANQKPINPLANVQRFSKILSR